MNRLAAYTANPSLQHVTTLKRILRYLAGTKNYGITYSKTSNNHNIFSGFADAAYQTTMIINQCQVMFSQQQGEQLPGNPRNKQL